jgi:hypothetical protein
MHVLHNRLLAPRMELADGCRNHVEAAPAEGYLEQVNGPVRSRWSGAGHGGRRTAAATAFGLRGPPAATAPAQPRRLVFRWVIPAGAQSISKG